MPHKKITSIADIDIINKKIIRMLKEDSKRSYKSIAEELDLSESTVRKRVNNLVDSGVITKFTIEVNPEYTKQNLTAFITIVPKDGKMNDLIDLVRNATHCSEVFCLNGKLGLLMITGAENANELDALAETYRIHPYIKEVTVGISLRNIKTGNCVARLPFP
ncbi:MAG: winged helix-turn-helix transcriptional regulator [Candidatus Lokiarchaeota archaeon]|nr:winged helix-turn-helix transcriptional regulator [Candidatus Lokiarchaeota archaeon]